MSDNRAHEWLDGEAAERLLSDGHDDPRAEALTRLLSAAAAPAPVDPAREEMAVAAFRAARDEIRSPSPARGVRSGHDWRRGGGRLRIGRSVRALTGALVATAALGGVAVAAATGTLPGALSLFNGPAAVTSPTPVADPTPSAGASGRSDDESPAGGTTRGVPSPAPSPSATGAGTGSAPGAAGRDEALCRAWEQAGHGKQGFDHKAFEQLVAEAGGRGKVHKYCAGVLGWNGKHNKNNNANNNGDNNANGDKNGDKDNKESGGKRSGGDKGDKNDDGSDGKGNGGGSNSHGDGHRGRGGSGDGHRHGTSQEAHNHAAGSAA